MGNCLGVCQPFAGPGHSKTLERIRTLLPDHRGPSKQRHKRKNDQSARNVREVKLLAEPTDDIKEHYDLCEELGSGQFGVIRFCINKQTGEKLACKSIAKGRLCSQKDADAVRREIDIMKQLQGHPRIVQLIGVYEDRTWVHLVMELCEGGDLFDRIVKQKLHSEKEAAMLCKSLIEAVQFCQNHRVIHRDLKPENILLVGSCLSQIKLADFGLAVNIEPGEQLSATAGSAYYIAPEVLKGGYGMEVDVWSAGVVLYILLCGVPPFWDSTEEGIFDAIRFGHLDLCSYPWPKISVAAKDLIRGMLCPDIRRRLTPDLVLSHEWIVKHTQEAKQENSSLLQQDELQTLTWCSDSSYFVSRSIFGESSSFLSGNFTSQASSIWDPSAHCTAAKGRTNASSSQESDKPDLTEFNPPLETRTSSTALGKHVKDMTIIATPMSDLPGGLQSAGSIKTRAVQLSKQNCSSLLECESLHADETEGSISVNTNRLLWPSCSSSTLHLQAQPQLVC